MKVLLSSVTLAVTCLLSANQSYAAVVIVNPGFEDPAHTNNDGTNPDGWTVIETTAGNNPTRQVRTRNTGARSGSMSLQLGAGNSNHDGELYQTVITDPGQLYTFSFWARTVTNNNAPANQRPLIDMVDGAGLGGSLIATSGAINTLNVTYTEYTFDFTAVSASTTIHIQDASTAVAADGNDVFLDDLSITAIPEPSVGILGLLSFLGFTIRRRRS